jgi:hypothetical protein
MSVLFDVRTRALRDGKAGALDDLEKRRSGIAAQISGPDRKLPTGKWGIAGTRLALTGSGEDATRQQCERPAGRSHVTCFSVGDGKPSQPDLLLREKTSNPT